MGLRFPTALRRVHRAAIILAASACTPRADPAPPPSATHTPPGSASPAPEPEQRWLDLAIDDELDSLACAVENTGSIWCWGHDPAIQTGARPDLQTDQHDTPAGRKSAAPSRLHAVTDARQVAVSSRMLCRIDTDRALHCLDAESSDWFEPEPTSAFVEVIIDDRRACALSQDERLLCWAGRDPAHLLAREVVDFDIAGARGCLLDRSGELSCWAPELRLDPLSAVREIAIETTGPPTAWALDDAGRLYSHRLDPGHAVGWQRAGQVQSATHFAAARSHQCVQTSAGEVLCRGSNLRGQLGDGSSSHHDHFEPMQAREVLGLDLSDQRSCIYTREEVLCTGLDQSREQTWQDYTLPDLVSSSLAAHNNTTCSRGPDTDPTLHCWGSDLLAGIGHRSSTFGIRDASSPTLVAAHSARLRGMWTANGSLAWAGEDGLLRHAMWIQQGQAAWVEVSPQYTIPLVGSLRDLGADQIVCTVEREGSDERLSCGRRPDERTHVPSVTEVLDLAVGHFRVCLIDATGAVLCGAYPKLDQQARLVPTRVRGVHKALALASTGRETCALVEDNRVSCWSNERVETGGEATLELRNKASRAKDIGLESITAIAASEDRFCSIHLLGHVRCWTPNGDTVDEVDAQEQPPIERLSVELVAGDRHFCSRDTQGRVSCWGQETHGQLGRIPAAIELTPRGVALPPPSL